MGDNAAGYNVTYSTIGNREDLTDVLTNISPVESPFFSSIGRVTATNTLHEWQTDALDTASNSNASVEGASADIASASVTSRIGNRTQIFQKVVSVSNTQIDGMNTAGRINEWSRVMSNKAKSLARDVEMSLVQNSAIVSAGAGVAPKMEGLGLFTDGSTGICSTYAVGFLSGNMFTGTAVGSTTGIQASGRAILTEVLFNNLLQLIWDNGGRPDMLLCAAWNKRTISSFSANATRYNSVERGAKVLSGSVSVYESDFGIIQLRLSHFCGNTRIGAIQTEYCRVAELRPLSFSRLAKDGDREKGQYVYEATLEMGAPLSGGMITNLLSASGAAVAFA